MYEVIEVDLHEGDFLLGKERVSDLDMLFIPTPLQYL